MKHSIQKYSEGLLRTEKGGGRLKERWDTRSTETAVGFKGLAELDKGVGTGGRGIMGNQTWLWMVPRSEVRAWE